MTQRIRLQSLRSHLSTITIDSRAFLAFFLFFSLIACSLPPTRNKAPVPPPIGASQTGIASWYGPGFHGQPTASGAIYNQHELTAAHQTLPLGTRVVVTNLENGRSTEVTINDRGPFVKGRILDLSYAAAWTLGMIGPGTIPVRIEVIDSGQHKIVTIPERQDYTVQVGSFAPNAWAENIEEITFLTKVQTYVATVNTTLVTQGGKRIRVKKGTKLNVAGFTTTEAFVISRKDKPNAFVKRTDIAPESQQTPSSYY